MLPVLRRKLGEHGLKALVDGGAAGDRPSAAFVGQLQDPTASILGVRGPSQEALVDETLDDLRGDREGQIELAAEGAHAASAPEADLPEHPELRGQESRGTAGSSQEGRIARQAAPERLDQEFLRIPAVAVGFGALSRHRMSQGPVANEFFSVRAHRLESRN